MLGHMTYTSRLFNDWPLVTFSKNMLQKKKKNWPVYSFNCILGVAKWLINSDNKIIKDK